jgi:hypothetical protein
MSRKRIKPIIFTLTAAIYFWINYPRPAEASLRTIFNENVGTIERYFGRYWTRLTTHNQPGNHVVTYTYSPGKLRSIFRDSDKLRLSVTFVNDRAQSIHIHQNGSGFTIPDSCGSSDLNFYPSCFDEVFAVVFGDRPPDSPLHGRQIYDDSGDGGTLHISTYCVAENTAISYEWISERDFVLNLYLLPESSCSIDRQKSL